MATSLIPVLPESAPFTAEQRAYLNGFFAGLFSNAPVAGEAPAPPVAAHPLTPLAILFGSQTGNCEKLAKRIAQEAGQHGFAPTIHDLAKYPIAQLADEGRILIVTSTYGDGEAPDNAKTFGEFLASTTAPKLPNLRFSVCALGDLGYAKFCGFGKDVDERLEQLGATRVHQRVDCDVEYEEPFLKWLHAALGAMIGGQQEKSEHSTFNTQHATSNVPLIPALSPSDSPPRNALAEQGGVRENHRQSAGESGIVRDGASRTLLCPLPRGGGKAQGEGAARLAYSRSNPFPARLLTNRKLNLPGSGKDVRHFELTLGGPGLAYEAGDALGVLPQNDPALVAELLATLGAHGEEAVPGKTGEGVSFREALSSHYEITRLPKPLLEALAARTGDEFLKKMSAPDANGELTKYLWGRQIMDLLLAHPEVKFAPGEFVALLRKLSPRLYSIASSPKAHAGEVHLTVGALRYESLGRARGGVCSTFLADRVTTDMSVPVFVQTNPCFRPPGPDVPLIMVGPGTGIAPFRAFLEERRAMGAQGENWLFFGDQESATDFLYREEIESFQKCGLLTRLELAWSRDQAEKIYVQQRLLERAKQVFDWLERGGSFYVCGDATRMAKDVDAALHEVIQRAGGQSPAQAAEYVARLKAQKRYQRDVY